MKNAKFITGFSIFGFLLSIISSFGSHRSFGAKIFLAVVFAVIFALCAFFISFLYTNFLEGESNSGFGEPSGAVQSGASTASAHAVDITVQDEELPSEENENQFFVGSKHQMLNEGDMVSISENENKTAAVDKIKMENQNSSAQPVNTPAANISDADTVSQNNSVSNNAGFVPVSLTENADNFSSIESKSADEVKHEEKIASMNSMPVMESADKNTGELDVLPDLEDISGIKASGHSNESGMAEGSDFSEEKNISGGSGASAEEVTQGKDAELMAKAISTLLAKE